MKRGTLEVKKFIFRRILCIFLMMTPANQKKGSPAESLLELCCYASTRKSL